MDDLISRRQAVDALGERPMVWTGNDIYSLGQRNQYDFDRLALELVPSAEPQERKTGEWIYCEDTVADCVDGYRCDQCGFFVPWDYKHKGIDFIKDYHFCPNCGSKMEVEHETD